MCTYLNKTGANYYFRRPVPDDLRGHFKTDRGNPRAEWKRALGTKDRETAKRLLRPHVAETDALIDQARSELQFAKPRTPEEVAAFEREAEVREAQAAIAAEKQRRQSDPLRRQARVLWRQRLMLSTAEMTPEEAGLYDLVQEGREEALAQLKEQVIKLADGRPTPYLSDRSTAAQFNSGTTLTALFERYALTGTANPKTVSRWRSRIAKLVEFLGHDDVTRVTRADLNRWVESLIADGLAKKTVSAGYLPPVKVTLALAHDDGTIPTNPASGLKVRAPTPTKLRDRDLTDEEAMKILQGSLQPQSEKLSHEHAMARRWVPWLCAYTGARVAEMTQLRTGDIQKIQGHWVVRITPEAGSTKDNKARLVPLHPHLIEQGILKLAKEGDSTPLFYREGTGNEVNPASKMRASDLGDWVRTLGVDDPNVQPNHGWRHRFKTIARVIGIPEELADRIQGHTPHHQGGKYGGTLPVATLKGAIERLPRYEVEADLHGQRTPPKSPSGG